MLSRADRKKAHDAATGGRGDGGDDPFGDNAGINLEGPDEITEQEIDDFFEVDRSSSIVEMSNTPVRPFHSEPYAYNDSTFYSQRIGHGLDSSPPRIVKARTRLVRLQLPQRPQLKALWAVEPPLCKSQRTPSPTLLIIGLLNQMFPLTLTEFLISYGRTINSY
jgi:hypothetical protein